MKERSFTMKKNENYDPYDRRVITPTIPKCVIKGDPRDEKPVIIHENRALWEKDEEEKGEK